MLPPWPCHCSWYIISRDLIPVYIRYLHSLWRYWSIIYLQPLWRSWSVVYLHPLWRFWSIVYCTLKWPPTTHFVYHAYSWPLYSYVSGTTTSTCSYVQSFNHCIVLIGWLVLPLGSSSLHFWDGLIMYFVHCMTTLTSHIRGHLL